MRREQILRVGVHDGVHAAASIFETCAQNSQYIQKCSGSVCKVRAPESLLL